MMDAEKFPDSTQLFIENLIKKVHYLLEELEKLKNANQNKKEMKEVLSVITEINKHSMLFAHQKMRIRQLLEVIIDKIKVKRRYIYMIKLNKAKRESRNLIEE